MKLKMLQRPLLKKSETKRMRREGQIPAALYNKNKPSETITIDEAEFNAILRTVQPGRLSSTILTLSTENGQERRAILKEIQYEPTTYYVRHLDFEELFDDVNVKVKIPIEFLGVADCTGVKLGGVLRQVIRHLRVCCLPKDIPNAFFIDVKSLQLGESKRLLELEIPQNVRPMANLNEVAVLIAKR